MGTAGGMLGRARAVVTVGLSFLAGQGCGSVVPGGPDLETTSSRRPESQELHRLTTPPWIRGAAASRAEAGARGVTASSDNQIFNILGRWWLPKLGRGTHMSTVHSSEVPTYGGERFQGQSFYILAGSEAGTQPLYRLSGAPSAGRMDSLRTSEGAYALEGPLGHPFTSQQEGTQPITRWFRATGPHDHMTARSGEAPAGYAQEVPLGYGYPRYPVGRNKHCTENFTAHGGEVDLAFSKVAGGSLWELWWNGKQFVNDWEYGRQIQAAVFLTPGTVYNPTEGGDTAGGGERPVCETLGAWAHGSPLLSYGVQVEGSETIVTTRTRPLQWDPKPFVCPDPRLPCDPDHPVLWKGRFDKRVTLNYRNHPKWIRWDLDTTFPSAWADPVGFVIAAGTFVADFSKLYAFDAEHDHLSEDKTPQIPDRAASICLWGFQDADLQPRAGGLIAATRDARYAVGVYHRSGNGFTHEDAFGLCAWAHGDGGQYGVKTYSWQVYHAAPGVSAGTYSDTVYLVVGTLKNVRDEMVAMKDAGL